MLTAAVALLATWSQFCHALQYSGISEQAPEADSLRLFAWALIQGSLFSGLLFLWHRTKRTDGGLEHPGHWILLLAGLHIPVTLVIHTIWSFQISQQGTEYTYWIADAYPSIAYCAASLAVAAAWAHAFQRMHEIMGVFWSLTFGLLACVELLTAIGHAFHASGNDTSMPGILSPFQYAALASMSVASISDWNSGTQRDWIHWFAILITFFAFAGNPVIENLANFAMTS